jgi:hypothetical protein
MLKGTDTENDIKTRKTMPLEEPRACIRNGCPIHPVSKTAIDYTKYGETNIQSLSQL